MISFNMFPFAAFFFFLSLLCFLGNVFSRIKGEKFSLSTNQIDIEAEEEEIEETRADATELKEKIASKESESPMFVFKFQFQTQTFEELSKKFREDENYKVGLESVRTNNYEFKTGNSFSCIMDMEDLNFSVKELYVEEEDFIKQNLEDEEEQVAEAEAEAEAEVEAEEEKAVSENDNEEESDVDPMKRVGGKLNIDDEDIDIMAMGVEEHEKDSDSYGLETLWEHQDLIEQLKMELKKVRAIGLPTILEESESPKIMDDLKPWRIDDKFHHVDRISELHRFYKSYTERMRKFDILNYQKMYAIGFVQSKDPIESISSSHPPIRSLLSLGRRKKLDFDPMAKFIKELHSDLEMVYVGQLCLSWEILHWQYDKAIEIWESDPPYSTRRFNEVAGEFQQFQVLMQRFIENEPFQGPRLHNYVKNRCVMRNLLQVPVIREDSIKDKRKTSRDDDTISSDMLVEIMEESIRIFWQFVRADKDANIVIQKSKSKSRKGTQVEPLDPNDLQLLAEVQTSLIKKDRKLKDMLRSGNCILRRLRKKQEDSSDQVLYFFSQLDLKLVARVLNMSKVTKDQLLWCHTKLSNINFVNRKIDVEPSFLLFPC